MAKSKTIDPTNEKQMKDNKIVEIIHGADKQEYVVSDKHPSVVSGELKKGHKAEAHPILVDKWEKHGWVKKTDKPATINKMPEPPKED